MTKRVSAPHRVVSCGESVHEYTRWTVALPDRRAWPTIISEAFAGVVVMRYIMTDVLAEGTPPFWALPPGQCKKLGASVWVLPHRPGQ